MWHLSKCVALPVSIRLLIYAIARFPNLRLLDFRKIKMAHRKEANDLFKSKRGKELLKEIAKRTKTGQPGNSLEANGTNGRLSCVVKILKQIFKYKFVLQNLQPHQLKLQRFVMQSIRPLRCRK